MIIQSWYWEGSVDDPCKHAAGKTVLHVDGLRVDSECVVFFLSDGSILQIAYHHDCCASCSILDMDCEDSDFINQKILSLEIVESEDPPPGDYTPDSYTWSFVKFSTTKGHFTMRWYGESNGYYSESPTIQAIDAEHARKHLNEADLVRLDRAMELGL